MDISVAIGRNVGDEPMSDEQWNRYKSDLQYILGRHYLRVTNREEGDSSYEYEGTWHSEQFHRVWATFPLPGTSDIRPDLAKLAKKYEQWGIAYTVAKFTEVVEAR